MEKKLSTWWKRYRITKDRYLGWQVDVWYIYWPFWQQLGFSNTFSTREKALQYAEDDQYKEIL